MQFSLADMHNLVIILKRGYYQWRRQLWELTRSQQGPENGCQVLKTNLGSTTQGGGKYLMLQQVANVISEKGRPT